MNKSVFIVFLFAVSLMSCTKMPVYQSKYVQNEEGIATHKQSVPFSYYDPDTKIRYDIYNSDSVLFIRFDVSDQLTMHKIFTRGLEVYIDSTGKRKTNTGISYPVPGAFMEKSVIPPSNGMRPQVKDHSKLSKLQQNINPNAIIIKNDEEAPLNLFSLDSPVTIRMRFSEDGSLQYETVLPLKYFGFHEMPESVVVGICSREDVMDEQLKEDRQNNDVNMQNSSMNRPYQSNNPMQNYTGNPNYMNQGMRQNTQMDTYKKSDEPIKIWFQLQWANEGINK